MNLFLSTTLNASLRCSAPFLTAYTNPARSTLKISQKTPANSTLGTTSSLKIRKNKMNADSIVGQDFLEKVTSIPDRVRGLKYTYLQIHIFIVRSHVESDWLMLEGLGGNSHTVDIGSRVYTWLGINSSDEGNRRSNRSWCL